jgi:hypothetical protein
MSNPFLRCGCGATWPCSEHDKPATDNPSFRALVAMQDARDKWWEQTMRENPRYMRPLEMEAFAAGYAAALESTRKDNNA